MLKARRPCMNVVVLNVDDYVWYSEESTVHVDTQPSLPYILQSHNLTTKC